MLNFKMPAFRTSRTFDVIFIVCLAVLIWISYLNRIVIGDTVFSWSYIPDAHTIQVADAAGLNSEGRRLLYRTNPKFVDKTAVTAACDIERLGCLSEHGQTYILDDPAKASQTIVTAAHEMLHLAYRRLSQSQKDDLAPLIDQGMALNSIRIDPELSNLTNMDDRRDEAHSLLGTEYAQLPSGLEKYYSAYFTDRQLVVKAEAADD